MSARHAPELMAWLSRSRLFVTAFGLSPLGALGAEVRYPCCLCLASSLECPDSVMAEAREAQGDCCGRRPIGQWKEGCGPGDDRAHPPTGTHGVLYSCSSVSSSSTVAPSVIPNCTPLLCDVIGIKTQRSNAYVHKPKRYTSFGSVRAVLLNTFNKNVPIDCLSFCVSESVTTVREGVRDTGQMVTQTTDRSLEQKSQESRGIVCCAQDAMGSRYHHQWNYEQGPAMRLLKTCGSTVIGWVGNYTGVKREIWRSIADLFRRWDGV
ncbi:hypothetical protein EDB85DRAFT_2196117 [Lactarius pseudohatsudake]|nr:hypothetical protein EDB85DRAFT_2196117 [Lactarius pseudohatsudake]